MIVLRDPMFTERIPDPELRRLVHLRFTQICDGEPYEYDRHGYMIVVEPGDTVESLEAETKCCILRDLWEDVPFGHPDFEPSCEILEEHPGCFELVFILSDSGFGVAIFAPKGVGVAAELMDMCRQFATPAHDPTPP